jgi:dTMP kinase
MVNTKKFIVLEGIDGSGKSTNLKFIKNFLENKELKVTTTREPGGTVIGEELRHMVLTTKMSIETEILIMFASRSELLNNTVIPSLKQDRFVICDRFTDSTYAYQGGGKNFDLNKISILEKWVQNNISPGLVIIFDVSPEVGLQRTGKTDKFENENLEFFKRAREIYLHKATLYPDIYKIINANKSLEKVQEDLLIILNHHFTNFFD